MQAREKQMVVLLTDALNQLVAESKKKAPAVKVMAERGLLTLRSIGPGNDNVIDAIRASDDVIQSFVLGCDEVKNPKLVQISVGCLHQLITNDALQQPKIKLVLDTLAKLIDGGLEELKILQCLLALATSSNILRGQHLSRAFALCTRIKLKGDVVSTGIAEATLRQMVTAVFERVEVEDKQAESDNPGVLIPARRHSHAPANLLQGASDAYLLFQDLCLLTNGEGPHWLTEVPSLDQNFGLELIETALTGSSGVFFRHREFTGLLKDRVCALVIRLFSPSIKHPDNAQKARGLSFPTMVRLVRVASSLVTRFRKLLVAECEIFVSILIRFLDMDKPIWQRALVLEVMHGFCAQPELLESFSAHYDMQSKTTKVFRDLVAAVWTLIKTVIDDPGRPERLRVGSPKPTSKGTFLVMLDKVDPPVVTDEYAVSVAFACVLDTVRSVSSLVTIELPGSHPPIDEGREGKTDLALLKVMVDSSFTDITQALSLLLDRGESEVVIDPILKSFTSMVRVCGALELATVRNTILAVFCAACTPPGYSLKVDTVSHTWVMSTKNLQCAHALANMSLCLGSVMHESWVQIIRTLQQLVTLADPPNPTVGAGHSEFSTGGGRPAKSRSGGHRRQNSGNFSGAATASARQAGQAAEIVAIGEVVSQVFTTSNRLDENSLAALMSAICAVSEDTLEMIGTASVNSALLQHRGHLFPVVKVFEVGMANLDRVMTFWPIATAHLIEVASHPNTDLRDAGLDALTRLVVAALAHPREPPIQECSGLQQALLSPLRNLSSCDSAVAQKRQLDCVYHVLDSCGDSLQHAWPVVIGIINDGLTSIAAATSAPNAAKTAKIACDSIKMVVTDFLPAIPPSCYPLLMGTIANFGKQNVDVNICLTAIGLLWNVSDHMSRQKIEIQSGLQNALDDGGAVVAVKEFKAADLWMVLYEKLAELCVDPRSEVRKSASQTLFSTITTHGNLLNAETWHRLVWAILLPLLENVSAASTLASSSTDVVPQGMLVHHSRNTAAKQWDETKVLSLQGTARVFTTFQRMLMTLMDYSKAWKSLLESIEVAVANESDEVSKAGIFALQESFRQPAKPGDDAAAVAPMGAEGGDEEGIPAAKLTAAWRLGFDTFVRVAEKVTSRRPLPTSQAYLVGVVESFPLLYARPGQNMTTEDFERAMGLIRRLGDLQHHEALTVSTMTQTQQAAISAVLAPVSGETVNEGMIPTVLIELVRYASLGCEPPQPPMVDGKPSRKPRAGACQALSLSAMDQLSKLFATYCDRQAVKEQGVIIHVMTVLGEPMKKKYNCPAPTLWHRAVGTFVSVVHAVVGGGQLHAALADPDKKVRDRAGEVWDNIILTIQEALFSDVPPPAELSADERSSDAKLDVELVYLVRDALLKTPDGSKPPAEFEPYNTELYALLSKATAQQADGGVGSGLARESFQTLLNVSLHEAGDASGSPSLQTPRSASMDALLQSCEEVLKTYLADEAASTAAGHTMKPERTQEAVYMIEAVQPIITPARRRVAVSLYTTLCKMCICRAPEIRKPLADVLMLYYNIMSP